MQRSVILNEEGLLDDEAEQREFVETEGLPFFTALEAVHLVADNEVWEAAHNVDVAFKQNIDTVAEWEALKQKFVDLAQEDIFPSE